MQLCEKSTTARQAPPTSNTGVLNPAPPVSALIDWLSFTAPAGTPVEQLFPMSIPVEWRDLPHGALGYRFGKQAAHVSVYWGGTVEGMGVHVVISGQGCRELEAWGLPSWWAFLKAIVSFGWHVSRLDWALDDHAGLLDMAEVVAAFSEGRYTSPSRKGQLLTSYGKPGVVDGQTCYLGSTKSDTRIRIYDKAAEQGADDGSHWVRVEMQLRSDRAHQAAVQYSDAGEQGAGMMAGLLLRQLDFKATGQADSHKSRQVTAPWWAAFVGTVEKIRLSMAPAQRSLEAVQGWLDRQVAPSLALVLAAAGGDLSGLVEMARAGRARWTATHRNMLAWGAPAPLLSGAGAGGSLSY